MHPVGRRGGNIDLDHRERQRNDQGSREVHGGRENTSHGPGPCVSVESVLQKNPARLGAYSSAMVQRTVQNKCFGLGREKKIEQPPEWVKSGDTHSNFGTDAPTTAQNDVAKKEKGKDAPEEQREIFGTVERKGTVGGCFGRGRGCNGVDSKSCAWEFD